MSSLRISLNETCFLINSTSKKLTNSLTVDGNTNNTAEVVSHCKELVGLVKKLIQDANALNADDSGTLDTADEHHVQGLKTAVTGLIENAKNHLAGHTRPSTEEGQRFLAQVTAASTQITGETNDDDRIDSFPSTAGPASDQDSLQSASLQSPTPVVGGLPPATSSSEVSNEQSNVQSNDQSNEPANDQSDTSSPVSTKDRFKAFGGKAWAKTKKAASGTRKKVATSSSTAARGLRNKWQKIKLDRQEAKRAKKKMKADLEKLKPAAAEGGSDAPPKSAVDQSVDDDLAALEEILGDDDRELETADDVAQHLVAVKTTREQIEKKQSSAQNQQRVRESVMVLRGMEDDLVSMLKRTSQRASQRASQQHAAAAHQKQLEHQQQQIGMDAVTAASKPTPTTPSSPVSTNTTTTPPPPTTTSATTTTTLPSNDFQSSFSTSNTNTDVDLGLDLDAAFADDETWDDIEGMLAEYVEESSTL